MHQNSPEITKPETDRLDGKARAVIDAYLALPIGPRPSCPYFNNKRRKVRSQLRVLKGKGSPWEIAEEAEIDAKHARVNIATLSTDKLKEFLISRDLGVDCSGFAYHVLDALAREKRGRGIRAFVRSNREGFIGSLIAKLRPAENMGVATFANERNSTAIDASAARPGDIVTFIGTGKDGLYNHILVVTGVERSESGTRLSYAHSYAWPSDGATDHGAREGDILIRSGETIEASARGAGAWKEKGVTGSENYTFESARTAKEVSVRRLRFLA
ncbi:MAG TPA: hypothetical protein VHD69_02800 [Candidatus Paceibacterota bacterium]|nr:hypothetical protein [Candidatus Paceibacterota bacterium]